MFIQLDSGIILVPESSHSHGASSENIPLINRTIVLITAEITNETSKRLPKTSNGGNVAKSDFDEESKDGGGGGKDDLS